MWKKSFERASSLCLHVLDRLKPSSAPRQNLLLPRTQRAQEEGCFSVVVYSRLFAAKSFVAGGIGISRAIQSSPCVGSDDAIGDKAMATLESAHCRLGFWSEVAVRTNSNFCLHLLYQVTSPAPPKRGSTRGCTGLGRRLSRRDHLRAGSRAGEDRDHA